MPLHEASILINLAELNELSLELCEKIASRMTEEVSREEFLSSCKTSLDQQDMDKLVSLLIPALTGSLLTPPSLDANAIIPETAFSLLLVILKMSSLLSNEDTIRRVCTHLTQTKDHLTLRSRCLFTLYHALPCTSPLRFEVFLSSVQYDRNSPLMDNYSLPAICELMTSSWGLANSMSSQRTLFMAIANTFPGEARGQEAVLAYLRTFTQADEAIPQDFFLHLRECVVFALAEEINASAVLLLQLQVPMQWLQKENPLLFSLLDVVCSNNKGEKDSTLDHYMQFVKQHGADVTMKVAGLEPNVVLDKKRLLTLSKLDGLLTYDRVASLLQVDKAEVENWVIRGISAGMVQAKMDQVNQHVLIHSFSVKSKNVSEQLKALSQEVSKVRQAMA